jgi:uncharacterized repeat protein (TIGR04052 family)
MLAANRRSLRRAFFTVLLLSLSLPASAATLDPAGQCVGDVDGDGRVTAEELVSAVGNSLEGCGLAPVRLSFRAQVGDEPFACGRTYDNIGTSASRWLPADLRFYVHGIRLVKADRSEVPVRLVQDIWQDDDTALLDFEDHTQPCNNGTPETNTTVRGVAPAGDYAGVRFTLGIPFAKNHQDASSAPSPLNLTSMFWSWQGGYKFLRLDSFTILEGDFGEFRLHLGSTGCRYGRPLEVAGCLWANRADVLLTPFDASRHVIVADLRALLADSDLDRNVPQTAPGCMSDQGDTDCEPLFRNLGIDFEDGFPTPATQKFFRLEAAAP